MARSASAQWTFFGLNEAPADFWEEWDRLNDAYLDRHPILSAKMIRTLTQYFCDEGARLARLRVDGRTIAQTVVEPAGAGQWRIVCPAQAALGLIVFERGEVRGLDALRSLSKHLGVLGLTVPYQDAPYSWLAGETGEHIHRAVLGTTVAIRGSDFASYWDARPKELKDNIRRRMRKAQQDNQTPRLVRVDDPAQVAAAVDRYGELESRGWKGGQGTAVHPGNPQGAFYRDLLRAFAAVGGGRVYELFCDEKLVASRLVVSGPGMYVILKTTYDEELRNYAPGHLQLYLILEELLGERPTRSVELYTKADRGTLLWATDTREIDTATLYRTALVSRLAHLRRRIRGGLSRFRAGLNRFRA